MGSKKGAESEDGSQGSAGWNSDTAAGASADGCRIFPVTHFQYEKNRWIVSLYDIDIKIVQSWAGCVIAATVIAFPLMYRNARAAFEQVDVNLIYAAQTLGMPEWKIFWRVIIAAGPGVASGTILAFARALGEYGATSMLAGNIPGKTGNHSQRIAMVSTDGD